MAGDCKERARLRASGPGPHSELPPADVVPRDRPPRVKLPSTAPSEASGSHGRPAQPSPQLGGMPGYFQVPATVEPDAVLSRLPGRVSRRMRLHERRMGRHMRGVRGDAGSRKYLVFLGPDHTEGRSRKPVYPQGYRGFESHLLRSSNAAKGGQGTSNSLSPLAFRFAGLDEIRAGSEVTRCHRLTGEGHPFVQELFKKLTRVCH
jgi:hypothetical protein